MHKDLLSLLMKKMKRKVEIEDMLFISLIE